MKQKFAFGMTAAELRRTAPPPPVAPPRPAQPTVVYGMTAEGRGVTVACLRCGTHTPIWGAPTIKTGHLARIANPRFMQYNAKLGTMDTRETIVVPFIRSGVGCPECYEDFQAVVAKTPAGLTAFIPDKD